MPVRREPTFEINAARRDVLKMRLGGVLLLSCFILIGTGCADNVLKRARIFPGYAAALCALELLFSGVELRIGVRFTLYPSVLLLAAAGIWLAPGRQARLYAALSAFVLGMLGWLLHAAFPTVEETGALVAVPAVVLACFFLQDLRTGLCAVLLMPLFFGAAAALEDWFLFDALCVSLGSRTQLDAQVCGAMGFLASSILYGAAVERRTRAKFMRQTAKNS